MKLPKVKGVRTIGIGHEHTNIKSTDFIIVKRNAYQIGAYSIHLTDNPDESKMKYDSVLGVSNSKQAATEFANQIKKLNGLLESKKMTKKQLEEMIKRVLNEEAGQLDNQDVKIALKLINAMASATAGLDYSTNDRGLKSFADKVRQLRIAIMEYVEENSEYSFYGKSPNGFKLVPKRK